MDFVLLRREIKSAAQAAFTQVRHSHSEENFYAFALSTDESAMSIAPAANTDEGLQ